MCFEAAAVHASAIEMKSGTAPLKSAPARTAASTARARRFKEVRLSTDQEPSGQSQPLVVHVVGDIAPSGETIGLQIARSEQGPVDLYIRTEDVKYLVSLLLNLGCEAKRRQSPPQIDAPPTEAIPLPLDAINVGQSDSDQPFLLLEVGITSLMFMVSPACLEQVGQTMLTLSAKSSAAPS
jgi:hypothetical protein